MRSMLKVILYMILFAILMSFHSCQKKANVEITNVVEEWINREIKFVFITIEQPKLIRNIRV